MARVSYSQVNAALRQAGFNPFQSILMSAIAMAESGLDSSAVTNEPTGGQSLGLFQIYQVVWGDQFGPACATDIQCSANAAWEISKHGTDYNPWSVYRFSPYGSSPLSGYANSFTKYLPEAMTALGVDAGTTIDTFMAAVGAFIHPGNDGTSTTDPHSIVDNLNDDEIKAVVSLLSDAVATQLFGFLPTAVQDAIKLTGKATGAALAAVVPTSVLRAALKQLPDSVLRDALAAAGKLGDAASAALDPFSKLLSLTLGDVKSAIVVASVLMVGGLFIAVGAWGLVQKSDTVTKTVGTAKSVGLIVATDGAAATASGAIKATARKTARATATAKREATKAAKKAA